MTGYRKTDFFVCLMGVRGQYSEPNKVCYDHKYLTTSMKSLIFFIRTCLSSTTEKEAIVAVRKLMAHAPLEK